VKSDSTAEGWNVFKDVDSWWFGYGSPVALGILRIIMSLLALEGLVIGLLDFEAWYTEKGFLPIKVDYEYWIRIPATFQFGTHASGAPAFYQFPGLATVPRINFFGSLYDSRLALALYLVVMIAALLTAAGLWTRVSSIVLALGIISIHHRNPLILHSGDTLMRLVLMYLAFSPCGVTCSLDRLIGLWKGTAPSVPPRVSLWPQRLIQYQVALVYFMTVWYKWLGTDWKNGVAAWFPENLHEFYRFPVPEFTHHQPFLALATYGTLVVELSLATLVFHRPLRKYVLLAGLAMHGYIEYRFNIPLFATIIVGTYIVFFDGEEITDWANRTSKRLTRFRIRVRLPVGTRLRPEAQQALTAMDPFKLVAYDTGVDVEWKAWNAQEHSKRPFIGAWIRSVGAWPIGLVPGLWKRLLTRGALVDGGLGASPDG